MCTPVSSRPQTSFSHGPEGVFNNRIDSMHQSYWLISLFFSQTSTHFQIKVERYDFQRILYFLYHKTKLLLSKFIVLKRPFKWYVTRPTFLLEYSKVSPSILEWGRKIINFSIIGWTQILLNSLNQASFLDFWLLSYFSLLMIIYFHLMKCYVVSTQNNS